MSTRREFLHWLTTGAFGAAGSLTLLGGTAHALSRPALEGGAVTVLHNATLIDGTDGAPRPDAVIVIAGETIVAVGHHQLPPREAGVTLVDLEGRYVLPGLWDMHTHGSWLFDTFLPLHVANGVMGVREMVGPPGMEEIRGLLETGELFGPRMAMAGALLDGPHSVWADGETAEGVVEATTPGQARAAVRDANERGADFVKVYSHLFPDVYRAAGEEANRLGIDFAGHVPIQVPVSDVAALGQHTVEHQYGMVLSTSRESPRLYRKLREMIAADDDPAAWHRAWRELEAAAVETHDPRLATRLFRLMARQGVWASPTVGVERSVVRPAEEILDDDRLRDLLDRFIHPSMRHQWLEQVRGRVDRPSERLDRDRARYELQLEMLPAMAEAGVGLIGGTDCWIPFQFPGFSLHDELELLNHAGLTARQTLQSVTRDAARCLGLDEVSGTVEAGKHADLVIVDRNPLEKIEHIRQVDSLVHRGRYISRPEREAILAEAERAAQNEPEWTVAPMSAGCCH